MGPRAKQEFTVDDFDAWKKAGDKFEKVAEAADEGGGPRLSLVPVPEQNDAWPTDLLPPAEPDSKSTADCSPAEAGAQYEEGKVWAPAWQPDRDRDERDRQQESLTALSRCQHHQDSDREP